MKLLLLLTLMFFIHSSHSTVRLGFNSSKNQTIEIGIPTTVELYFMPSSEITKAKILKFENTFFQDAFYINEVINVFKSENNQDVWVAYVNIVFLKSREEIEKLNVLKVDELILELDTKNLVVKENNVKQIKEFHILSQSYSSHKNIWLFLLISLFIFLLAVVFYKLKTKEKKLKRKAYEEKRDSWSQLIKDAKTRKQLEVVYIDYREWSNYLNYKNSSWSKFKKLMDDIAFKKEWSEEEKEVVVKNYEKFKDSIGVQEYGV